MAIRGTTRGKRYRNVDALKAAVKEHCAAEFEAALGQPWRLDEDGEAVVAKKLAFHHYDYAAERKAIAKLGELRQWVDRAKLATATDRPGPAVNHLRLLVSWLADLSRWDEPERSDRATLVKVLDYKNVFQLPRSAGRYRFLNAREMAFVSLLCGNFPEWLKVPANGLTVADVIRAESKTMDQQLREHGQRLSLARRGPKPSR